MASAGVSFTGTYAQKIDGKGRMLIPAKIRAVLDQGDPDRTPGSQPRFVLAYGLHLRDHLRLYTITEFETLNRWIDEEDDGSDEFRGLRITYIAMATEMEVDKDGRIVLPAERREKIGVQEGEISFLGLGKYCELWKASTFEERDLRALEAALADKPAGYDPIQMLGKRGAR